jgi:hypothetical protein
MQGNGVLRIGNGEIGRGPSHQLRPDTAIAACESEKKCNES